MEGAFVGLKTFSWNVVASRAARGFAVFHTQPLGRPGEDRECESRQMD